MKPRPNVKVKFKKYSLEIESISTLLARFTALSQLIFFCNFDGAGNRPNSI